MCLVYTILFFGNHYICKTGINNFLFFDEGGDPLLNGFQLLLKHGLARFNKFGTPLEDVSIIRLLAENIFDPRLHPLRSILINAEFLCDRVCRYKPDTVNVISETIRVFSNDRDCVVFVCFINFSGVRRANIVRL